MKCPLRLFAGDSQWLLPPPPKGLHDLEQLVMVQETLGSRILHQDHCFFAYLGANRSLLMGIEVGIFFRHGRRLFVAMFVTFSKPFNDSRCWLIKRLLR